MICVIGCGGVGSQLLPSLVKLVGNEQLCLVDGDKLEEKNLDRQLFTKEMIGKYKAQSLAVLYGAEHDNSYFETNQYDFDPSDFLFCLVDNNAARLAALSECDRCGCDCIIAANETTSAEAYYYTPVWRETQLDPRIMYPEMNGEDGQDPRRRQAGCTGKAQEQNRQLVSANFMAAALAQHLFVFWQVILPKMQLKREERISVMNNAPHKLVANLSRIESFKVGRPLATPVPEFETLTTLESEDDF
jgi:molybdopterin/thiamine biosynthesis adenylyltransferase